MVLSGCCEFNPHITPVKIYVYSQILMPHAAGRDGKPLGQTGKNPYSMHYAGRLIDFDVPKFSMSNFALEFFDNLWQNF